SRLDQVLLLNKSDQNLLNTMFDYFFFQAEDGIRDFHVTGVQTCALPIFSSTVVRPRSSSRIGRTSKMTKGWSRAAVRVSASCWKIGRASCRERVEVKEVGGNNKK